MLLAPVSPGPWPAGLMARLEGTLGWRRMCVVGSHGAGGTGFPVVVEGSPRGPSLALSRRSASTAEVQCWGQKTGCRDLGKSPCHLSNGGDGVQSPPLWALQ